MTQERNSEERKKLAIKKKFSKFQHTLTTHYLAKKTDKEKKPIVARWKKNVKENWNERFDSSGHIYWILYKYTTLCM